jgi:hypothetical protein
MKRQIIFACTVFFAQEVWVLVAEWSDGCSACSWASTIVVAKVEFWVGWGFNHVQMQSGNNPNLYGSEHLEREE